MRVVVLDEAMGLALMMWGIERKGGWKENEEGWGTPKRVRR
jgi:hypothetical protein